MSVVYHIQSTGKLSIVVITYFDLGDLGKTEDFVPKSELFSLYGSFIEAHVHRKKAASGCSQP
jgi:predicted DNA-binding protein with PD1-like motif